MSFLPPLLFLSLLPLLSFSAFCVVSTFASEIPRSVSVTQNAPVKTNSRVENAREDYSDYLIAPALGVALAALRAACRVLAERGYAPVSAGRKILVIFAAFCNFSSSSVPRGGHDITRRRRNFLINYENRELPEKPENASESSAM